jgi:hypothetical protein
VSLLGVPKLAGTVPANFGAPRSDLTFAHIQTVSDCLDVRKGEVLVVGHVVEDLVVRGAKGTVVGGFEGSQNDGSKYVVNGERAHVIKSSADIADFTEVGVDSVLGVAIPGHKASEDNDVFYLYLTSNKDSLHALVLERENSEKGFSYLLSAQKLGRAALVKNGVGVGELGPVETQGGGIRCLQEDRVRVRTPPSMIVLWSRR